MKKCNRWWKIYKKKKIFDSKVIFYRYSKLKRENAARLSYDLRAQGGRSYDFKWR